MLIVLKEFNYLLLKMFTLCGFNLLHLSIKGLRDGNNIKEFENVTFLQVVFFS
jgi:hypothetical protein